MTRPFALTALTALLATLLLLPVGARADLDDQEEDDGQAPLEEVRQPAPAGQWIETEQYGQIWMPYADEFTSVPPGGAGEPYAYVYAPSTGWCWVVAPWIWGWGPWPSFGFLGPRHFGWYGHGWWRTPSRWRDQPSYRPGGAFRGDRWGAQPGGLRGHAGAPSGYRGPAFDPGGRALRGGGAPSFSGRGFMPHDRSAGAHPSGGGGRWHAGGGRGGGHRH